MCCTLKAANELGICIIKVAIKFLQTILFHIVGAKPKVPTVSRIRNGLFLCWKKDVGMGPSQGN